MGTDETAGLRLGMPSCYGFSNPFTSELAGDCEKSIAHFASQIALLWSIPQNRKLRVSSTRCATPA
jgi:hypothetical protein